MEAVEEYGDDSCLPDGECTEEETNSCDGRIGMMS